MMLSPRQKIPPLVFESLDFAELAGLVCCLSSRENPAVIERDRIWRAACEMFRNNSAPGGDPVRVKLAIVKWLWEFGPALAASEAALLRNFERKFQAWNETGEIADRRREAAKARRAPKLCEADREALVWCAVWKHGGDLDPAWATCALGGKLSESLLARYPVKDGQRLRCPNAIRRQIDSEVQTVYRQLVGPRSAKLNGACIQRDWSGVFANDWHSSDDITLPVYYYLPDGKGWFYLTRGQFLPMIDIKSKRVLDFVLIDSKSYNAAAIRGLINHTCDRHALPRVGWHFESGIWKTSKMVGGRAIDSWNENDRETFASRLGLRLMHSQPGNARAKIIENVAGRLQDLMEGEPGYIGRAEMTVKFERVQKDKRDVETRRIHPAKAGFYSGDEWLARLHEICAEYNAKPQTSRLYGGERLSPDEAFEKFQKRDAACAVERVTKLPTGLRYLLAAHKETVTVSRKNGISLFGGKFRYISEVTGALQGQSVVVWFDPDRPETVAVTDLDGENMQTIPRCLDVPAMSATHEEIANGQRATSAHAGYGRKRYSELAKKFELPARRIITDAATVEKGERMETQRVQVLESLKPKQNTARDRAALARELEDFERTHEHLLV